VASIKKRLGKKDYTVGSTLVNPFKEKAERANGFLVQLDTKYGRPIKHNLSHQISNRERTYLNFRMISNSEFETIGIDIQENYDMALYELTDYYNGIATNYSMTYLGAEQFFQDCEQLGMLTWAQSNIIQSELNAVLQATSVEQMRNINQTVEQEVIHSSMSYDEKSLLLTITAQIDILLMSNFSPVSLNSVDSEKMVFQTVGMASWNTIAGFALAIAGITMMSIGTATANPVLFEVGIAVGFFGMGLFID
jgi:hypothetical protein